MCVYICWDTVNLAWGPGTRAPSTRTRGLSTGSAAGLKGPTHPWLNAPGLYCPQGCWFYRPIHSIAPQMDGGKGRDDLPYAEGAAVHMDTNNVHINTRASHARHVHFINLSSLRSRAAYKGVFCSGLTRTKSWKMSGTFSHLIGYWQKPPPPAHTHTLCFMHVFKIQGKQFLDYYYFTFSYWGQDTYLS